MVTHISSKDNKIYKLVQKLTRRSVREKEGLYIAEGERLVNEAADANCINFYVSTKEINTHLPQYILSEAFFKGISQTKSPQGIMAVCNMPRYSENDFLDKDCHFVLACDRLSDPGNLGTIIRTAEAAGVDFVLLTKQSVDAFNPKTVRATMGSIFRMPIIQSDTMLDALSKKGYKIIVTSLDKANCLYQSDLTGDKIVIVIGNEAIGVSQKIQDMATYRIKIPMSGRVESLNAAASASIILYECKRQRGLALK